MGGTAWTRSELSVLLLTPGPLLSALGSSGWERRLQVKEGLIPARLGGQNGLLGDSGPER